MSGGWDGYGAPRIATDTILFAQQILIDLWASRLLAPDISAMSNGSLAAEFRRNGFELTIEISGPYKSIFLFERPAGQSVEGAIGADISELRAHLAEMMADDNVVVLVA